ncbi:MAG: helix-turn-helix transcriptional regulator [Clostridia bacterium]|nr:helix-turn-helix transcriptional regulator [Clostridia bacterium]
MRTRQEIGEAIKRARTEKGMTQRELAVALGYPDKKDIETNVRTVELGKKYPPFERIRTLHEVLEIPYDELLP